MRSSVRRAASSTFALVIVIAVGACSGAVDDAASTVPEISTTARPSTVPAAIENLPDPCELITVDEVAAATGLVATDAVAQPPIGCVFELGGDAGVAIFVAVEDGEGRMTGPANMYTEYSKMVDSVERISDLGVEALYEPNFRTVVVDAGDGGMFAIGVNGGFSELPEPREALSTLARSALDRL